MHAYALNSTLILTALTLVSSSLAAPPKWTSRTIQGITFKVPAGWKVVSSPGLVSLSDGASSDPPTGMVFAWTKDSVQASSAQLSENIVNRISGTTPFELIGEQRQNVLSRLWMATGQDQSWYISTASYVGDASHKGSWIAAFSASGARFNALGGAMFPFAVLGKVSDAQLTKAITQASQQASGLKKTVTAPAASSSSDPLDRAFQIMQTHSDQVYDEYEAAMRRYNAAWDHYERTIKSLCSGDKVQTQAELERLQRSCQAAVQGTATSIHTWHQTNQTILYNTANQPWCYADKFGTCR